MMVRSQLFPGLSHRRAPVAPAVGPAQVILPRLLLQVRGAGCEVVLGCPDVPSGVQALLVDVIIYIGILGTLGIYGIQP